MKMRLSRIMVTLLVLTACDGSNAPKSEKVALNCNGYNVTVELGSSDRDTLQAVINGEKITMHSVISASGAKYEGRGAAVTAVLWNKGKDWSLGLNDGKLISCKPSAK